MAKKKTKKAMDKTIVKNGKRVPASEKGKGKAEKTPKPDKDAQKKRIAAAVWKATEASRTTIGKLAALVDTFEEYDEKAEGLREEIGGLKGQIAEDKAEIRRIVREDGDNAEADKLKSLERDIERREVKLSGKQEERSGAREAMKCAMADMRKIIREGPGLYDQKAEETKPTGAGKAKGQSSTGTSAESQSTPPIESAHSNSAPTKSSSSTTDPKSNGTHPPSKSQAGPQDDEATSDKLKAETCASVLTDFPLAVEALTNAGVITLYDAAQKGKVFLRSAHGAGILSNLVQKLFDRIHFLRTGEDRNAEKQIAQAAGT